MKSRLYNRTGCEGYFWYSSKDTRGHLGKRFLKRLIRRFNRRKRTGHVHDALKGNA